MFTKILIANRGEIACRVIRTARAMGVKTVAIYSDADRHARHTQLADEAIHIGPAPARESYLKGERIIAAAKSAGAQAIHPGYGFLSENAAFAKAVTEAGLVFIGPPAKSIEAMGAKDAAKVLMRKAGVPVVPGYEGKAQDAATLQRQADKIGYPILIKAVMGGGGRGMRKVDKDADFAESLESAQREAQSAFGDSTVLIEKYLTRPRHIEVQVFADGHGNVVHLFERDCSLQRRHQKVIEEAPAPGMTEAMRKRMTDAAIAAARAIDYVSAGTVEFIAEGDNLDNFYFMEMNTRLQVEHPVTEMVTGLDLVEWQLCVAAGERLPKLQDEIALCGHAFEARICAEDPARDYRPETGRLLQFSVPEGPFIRLDSGFGQGDEISVHYDSLIGKLIVGGADRDDALARLRAALGRSHVAGIASNLNLLTRAAGELDFGTGHIDTGFIAAHPALLRHTAPDFPGWACLALAEQLDLAAARATDASPWAATDNWRLGGLAPLVWHFEYDGVDHAVSLLAQGDHWLVSWRDEALPLRLVERRADSFTIELGDRQYHAHLHADGATRWLKVGPTRWRVRALGAFGRPPERRDQAGGHGGSVSAPMPGRIVSVQAAIGDMVVAGQILLRLEAMKMEHNLVAGSAGKIAAVLVAPGDQVVEGAELIRIEAGA
ncbi:acetyl/propionyl/methylcrotonyl-CoA carboxylase subunit alpha [Dongia rigui]|uniref:Acetyl/propionyl/methylcrotonyl-CoA carboxylase subunit alpha n=1 Tax=Dongia rigui TaxID=940149 RepID=A0ABU5DUN9_9PROT|nr:acetyl/propionyl/methylcrotonyl-CoA carboxylase subunit alpha [Dongia rigui]MDY0871028.1 acetyl/propionyl/methylcrotonyl-CoA carboxylase subunit alpha [Dongia rigui]